MGLSVCTFYFISDLCWLSCDHQRVNLSGTYRINRLGSVLSNQMCTSPVVSCRLFFFIAELYTTKTNDKEFNLTYNPCSCLPKFGLMTTCFTEDIAKITSVSREKIISFTDNRRKDELLWVGLVFFPLEIPTDIVLSPADDLWQQGRGDLSKGVGNISEVTH